MIRPALQSDLDAIYKISLKCFDTPWSLQSITENFLNENTEYYVYSDENSIIGFLSILNLDFETEILNIAVLPEYQNRGIGSLLLTVLPQNDIFLEVRQSNQAAISLYKKTGFKQISVRQGYYKNPVEDAIIMKKSV